MNGTNGQHTVLEWSTKGGEMNGRRRVCEVIDRRMIDLDPGDGLLRFLRVSAKGADGEAAAQRDDGDAHHKRPHPRTKCMFGFFHGLCVL